VIHRREFLGAATLAALSPAIRSRGADTITVPARAVTKGPKHHFFGYYDKTPWDKTGRYLLAMETSFIDRQPNATDALTLGMVDLKDNDKYIPFDTTLAWSWQQGTMLQWVGSAPEKEVAYNVLHDGKPAAAIRNVLDGKVRYLPMPIYALSNDGKQAVTLDFARLHRLRPGYGYASYTERFADQPAPEELGIWHMDVTTGKSSLIVSIARLAANNTDARFPNTEHWVNHLQFNPAGTRFIFLHRWKKPNKGWDTRLYTAKPDGTDLRLHLDDGMVSHFDWRDDRTILAWAKTKKDGNKFYTVDVNSNEATPVYSETTDRDGHCSYSPDRAWVLNDTYPDKSNFRHLMLLKAATGRRYDLNKFHSPPAVAGPFRCDLHPRWNRDGTMVCIDSAHEPTRQMYVLDVREIVKS